MRCNDVNRVQGIHIGHGRDAEFTVRFDRSEVGRCRRISYARLSVVLALVSLAFPTEVDAADYTPIQEAALCWILPECKGGKSEPFKGPPEDWDTSGVDNMDNCKSLYRYQVTTSICTSH